MGLRARLGDTRVGDGPAHGLLHRPERRAVGARRRPVRSAEPAWGACSDRATVDGRRDALPRPDRLSVALPARALPTMGRRLAAVAALASERGVGQSDGSPPWPDPPPPRPPAAALDGHHRRPDGEGRSLRADLPPGRRPRGPDDRGQADCPRRDPRAARGGPRRVGSAA